MSYRLIRTGACGRWPVPSLYQLKRESGKAYKGRRPRACVARAARDRASPARPTGGTARPCAPRCRTGFGGRALSLDFGPKNAGKISPADYKFINNLSGKADETLSKSRCNSSPLFTAVYNEKRSSCQNPRCRIRKTFQFLIEGRLPRFLGLNL